MFKPKRLLVNELRTGEYEFSAHFEYSPTTYEEEIQIRWEIQTDDSGWAFQSKSVLASQASNSLKYIHLASILPTSWNQGSLHLEIEDSQKRQEFDMVVSRYDQPVDFILPLMDSALTVVGHNVGDVHRIALQVPSQQFGWDFLGLGKKKLSIVDIQSPSLTASHFSGFGAQVIAPANAKVFAAKDGEEDLMEIGVLPKNLSYFTEDPTRALGNHVILEHAPGLYSVLAHLQKGSLDVASGQQLSTGDPIAALGNSGYSSGPHLHFHVMDGPDILTASPLPVVLHLEDGIFDPQGGDIVSNG